MTLKMDQFFAKKAKHATCDRTLGKSVSECSSYSWSTSLRKNAADQIQPKAEKIRSDLDSVLKAGGEEFKVVFQNRPTIPSPSPFPRLQLLLLQLWPCTRPPPPLASADHIIHWPHLYHEFLKVFGRCCQTACVANSFFACTAQPRRWWCAHCVAGASSS